MKQTVLIEGMHCTKCAERVTRVFTALDGVESVSVDLEQNAVILAVNQPLDEALLRETVEDLGFDFVRAE